MNAKRRTARRPYVRQRSARNGQTESALQRVLDTAQTPSDLQARAGAARPAVEPLEPRQMLFALTVASGAPGNFFVDGVEYGTVTTDFGYVIPYLFPVSDQGDSDGAEVRVEDFSEFATTLPPQTIVNNTVFADSFLQVGNNFADASNVSVVPAAADPSLGVTFSQVGDELRLRMLSSGDNGAVRLVISELGASISGLDLNDVSIELRLNGDVVGSFTNATEVATLSSNGTGTGRFTFASAGVLFDEVAITRTSATGGSFDTISVDDVQLSIGSGPFADIVAERIFGARAVFTAPVGATVEFLDLYGRQMVNTLALGAPDGAELPLVDSDGDGIPNFNDGIGRINMTGTDILSSFAISGGTIDFDNDTGFVFTLSGDTDGLVSEFIGAGFGHFLTFDDTGNLVTDGIAPVASSVIVGSPIVRDLGDYAPGGAAIQSTTIDQTAFNNAGQGVFVTDGSDMGSVNVMGLLYGSSDFGGAVQTFAAGALYGSLTVDGDLGSLIVASEAGGYRFAAGVDLDGVADIDLFRTGSQIFVGRTLGQYHVGGRSVADITVVGDTSLESGGPARGVTVYNELERIYGIPLDTTDGVAFTINTSLFATAPTTGEATGPAYFLGDAFFRNEDLLAAEYIGSAGTATIVTGSLGLGDPISNAEDSWDTFAFTADGTEPIFIEAGVPGLNYRVVNSRGDTVAAIEGGRDSMTFTPDTPGVYYIVVSDAVNGDAIADGNVSSGVSYNFFISGMTQTAFGAYRVGAGVGARAGNSTRAQVEHSVAVLSGNLGHVVNGSGYVDGGGSLASALDWLGTDAGSDEALFRWVGSAFIVEGNLYNVTAGGRIAGNNASWDVSFSIGGNLGTLTTAGSSLAGGGALVFDGVTGDVNGLQISTGGAIGLLDIRGAVGFSNEGGGLVEISDGAGALVVTVGTDPSLAPTIGVLNIDGIVSAGQISVTGPAETEIGAFLVSRALGFAETGVDPRGVNLGILSGAAEPIDFNLGAGSNIGYFSAPRVDNSIVLDPTLTIPTDGSALTLTDDGGGRVQIRINAGTDGTGVDSGVVRYLPVAGGEGGVIAQIDVDLSNGGTLEIISLGDSSDVISIGTVLIRNATNNSSFLISGSAQVDVWLTTQIAGGRMDTIRNTTINGDFVAVDVTGVSVLSTLTGDIGRTEVPDWGPRLIGPRLGVQSGNNATVGGALGISPAAVGPAWDGTLYAAFNRVNPGAGTGAGDDVGLPMNPYLNGLVSRSGNVGRVAAGGSIGDVILQGAGSVAAGQLLVVTANADNITAPGEFDGLVGIIYADVIGEVNVGDGLVGSGDSPVLTSGIFATDDIRVIRSTRAGADISGEIGAFNVNAGTLIAQDIDDATGTLIERQGIGLIESRNGGDLTDLYIGVTDFNAFWRSGSISGETGITTTGTIWQVLITNGDLFRSQLIANDVGGRSGGNFGVAISGGFYDATNIEVTNQVFLVSADGFRNSTILGSDRELTANVISAQNLREVRTRTNDGEIRDLTIFVQADILDRIRAGSITRSSITAANSIALIDVDEDLRSSFIETGNLARFDAGDDVVSSEFSIAGPIVSMTVAGSISSTLIQSTGPDGRIDLIRAADIANTMIFSSGRIARVETTVGDLEATINTITDRGVVDRLIAERDLILTANVSGGINTLEAGRHIGRFGENLVIEVRSDLGSATSGGQLYSDIIVGGAVTGSIRIGTDGPNFSLPGRNFSSTGDITAASRINTVEIDGDYSGSVTSNSGGISSVTINQGSFLAGGGVFAYDGDIGTVLVDEGNLYADIYADYTIFVVEVRADDDGVYGDIGINSNPLFGTSISASDVTAAGGFNRFVTSGGFRTILPPGVAFTTALDGPTIQAGQNIGNVITTNGSVFETKIIAGHAIGFIEIAGSIGKDAATIATSGGRLIQGSLISAGDSIFELSVTGAIGETFILAGVTDLGDDGFAGGTGSDADTGKMGFIETINAATLRNVIISAGVGPGADGLYNNSDDQIRPGASFVDTIGVTTVSNVSIYSDAFGEVLEADSRFTLAGSNLYLFGMGAVDLFIEDTFGIGIPLAGALGAGFTDITAAGSASFDYGGVAGTITVSGDGGFFFDEAGRTLVFQNTNFSSRITIDLTEGSTLSNFNILGLDDASIGQLNVNANLDGTSWIFVDAYAQSISTGAFGGSGGILVGAQATSISTGAFSAPVLYTGDVATLTITGNLGAPSFDQGTAVRGADNLRGGLDLLAVGSLTINGDIRARVNIERNAVRVDIGGGLDNALFRIGGASLQMDIGSLFTTGPDGAAFSARESRISINNFLDRLTADADVFDTSILVGGDLGRDGDIGGGDDQTTSGNLGTATFGGGFFSSDLIAGATRGSDGFFGTSDDRRSSGLATIGNVTIAENELGSDFNSESYRITGTSLGTITVAGVEVDENSPRGNFEIDPLSTRPLAIRVTDLRVTQASRVYTAEITFNQAMDASSFAAALSVINVKSASNQVTLTNGNDYTLEYDEETFTLLVRFSTSVTDADIADDLAGSAASGIYRFVLDQETLRAAAVRARLDGDGDFAVGENDDFSADDIVGDAGDRLASDTGTSSDSRQIDFFAPVNLDIVLDNNYTSDGVPDVNQSFTVRGSIGDHPDNGVNGFRFGNDLDLYNLTLRAGQIIRFGDLTGAASADFFSIFLLDPNGDLFVQASSETDALRALRFDDSGLSALVLQTGVFTIGVGSSFAFNPGDAVPNADAAPDLIGPYSFNVSIFDDGDSGFNGSTDSGDGDEIVNAPLASAFSAVGQVINVGDFAFTLNADGTVTGTSNDGKIVSSRATDGTLTSTVTSTIGSALAAGRPSDFVSPDVDVFHLNNGGSIAGGTQVRLSVKLADLGSDLGSIDASSARFGGGAFSPERFEGDVQFAVFDTSASTGLDDANLLFSPGAFKPIADPDAGTLAIGENATYGYDANGDFFIQFTTPNTSSYAVYLQGAFNSAYQLEVTTLAAGATFNTGITQNFLLETDGGFVDWLAAGGLLTEVGSFEAAVSGFVGELADGRTPTQFIIDFLVGNAALGITGSLNDLFSAAGVDVTVSTNPADFEFEDFSTVFLTSTADPITSSITSFGAAFGFSVDQPFGYSEGSDPLNANSTDEAVVFASPFNGLEFDPNTADLTNYARSLTAAIGKRMGELLGLRITDSVFATDEATSSSGVLSPLAGTTGFEYNNASNRLSGAFDTDFDTNFYLGNQNSGSLLDDLLAAP